MSQHTSKSPRKKFSSNNNKISGRPNPYMTQNKNITNINHSITKNKIKANHPSSNANLYNQISIKMEINHPLINKANKSLASPLS